MNRGSAHQVHINNIGLLYDIENDVLNADFKRPVTSKIFPVYTEYFRCPTGNQHKITTTSKYLSHFGCHSVLYQKMAHNFGRTYFKLTFNGTVIFR